jgi:hypothetical protein
VQTRYTRQDKAFVRKAASGDWRSVLPQQSVKEIETAWGSIMTHLGYALSTDSKRSADVAQVQIDRFRNYSANRHRPLE